METDTALGESSSAATSPLSDEEIVERVRAGETALFELLMRRYNQRLFRMTRSILRNAHEAEDVMQDAYVRAYTSLHQFEGRAQFSTWLVRIAVHEAFSRLKERKRLEVLPGDLHLELNRIESMRSSVPDPEQELSRREAASLLEQAVDALPDMYRCVFVCREIENMSTTETADCLDITEETVKIRLYRARQMLQTDLYARVGATGSQAFQFLGATCDRLVHTVLHRAAESRSTR